MSERWAESCDDVRTADLALSRDPERRLALEGTRALGDALAGRPVDALRVAAGIRHAATVSNLVGPASRAGACRGHRPSRARRPIARPHRARGAGGDAGGDDALLPDHRHAGAHRGPHRRRRARRRSWRLRTSRVADRVRVVRTRLPAVAGQSWNTAGCRRRRHRRRDASGRCRSTIRSGRVSAPPGPTSPPGTWRMPPPRWTPQSRVVCATRSSSDSFAHESRPTTMSR